MASADQPRSIGDDFADRYFVAVERESGPEGKCARSRAKEILSNMFTAAMAMRGAPTERQGSVYDEPNRASWHRAAIHAFGEDVGRQLAARGWRDICIQYGTQILKFIP